MPSKIDVFTNTTRNGNVVMDSFKRCDIIDNFYVIYFTGD